MFNYSCVCKAMYKMFRGYFLFTFAHANKSSEAGAA